MAKVVMFPMKKKLPTSIEERLYEIAKEYVGLLHGALVLLSDAEPSQEDMEEITELVVLAYARGINDAIDELEEL